MSFAASKTRTPSGSAVRKQALPKSFAQLSQREKEFLAGELVGEEVSVEWSSCKEFAGLQGRVVDETQGTFVVQTPAGEKRVPKNSCAFSFPGAALTVDGRKLLFRPEDRTKKMLEKK